MWRFTGSLLMASMAWTAAHAGSTHVNPKNGNFYITYADEPGDLISRTYNNKSVTRGWFGFGWGSHLEGRIFVLGPESAAYSANGSGAVMYFGPSSGEDPTRKAIEQIIADRTASDRLDSYEIADLRVKLADEEEQLKIVRKYGMNAQIKAGTRLQSRNCADQTLTRDGGNYVVHLCDGRTDYFNERGAIIKAVQADGRVLTARYQDGPYPDAIEDSAGHGVHLQWNLSGQITRLSGKNRNGTPLSIDYTYDAAGDLVDSKDSGGNQYRYAYTGNHDMSEITYVDDSKMRMTYDANSATTSVVERDGSSANYEYWTDATNGDNWTRVTRADVDQAASTITLGWTKDGRPRRLENAAGEWAQYQYDVASGKVSSVRSENDQRSFKYDARGDVIFVQEERTGNIAWLDYNDQRQIVRVRQWNREERKTSAMTFRYGPLGKPTEIRAGDGGLITIDYEQDGEIKSVKSNKGAQAALALTMAFQQLTELVQVPQP
jgi:YD repeat-containing protein